MMTLLWLALAGIAANVFLFCVFCVACVVMAAKDVLTGAR
jgi:hypothetical protein